MYGDCRESCCVSPGAPFGAVVSTLRGPDLPGFNHRFDEVAGVREEACRALMQAFVRERR